MNQKPEWLDLQSDPSEQVVFLFKSIQKIYRERIFEKSRQYGFTGPQIGLILGFKKNPFSTLSEISECLGLSKSTVSGIVDRLVEKGVVLREIPENNRRIVQLSLSPEFQKNNVMKELNNKYITEILKDVCDEDMEKIISGLEILYTLMKKTQNDEPS